MEKPTEIPLEPTQDPSPRFHSILIQICHSTRNDMTQIVSKTSCKGELSMSVNEHNHDSQISGYVFSNPELQVDIRATYQDAGVHCDLFQFLEHTPLRLWVTVRPRTGISHSE